MGRKAGEIVAVKAEVGNILCNALLWKGERIPPRLGCPDTAELGAHRMDLLEYGSKDVRLHPHS